MIANFLIKVLAEAAKTGLTMLAASLVDAGADKVRSAVAAKAAEKMATQAATSVAAKAAAETVKREVAQRALRQLGGGK